MGRERREEGLVGRRREATVTDGYGGTEIYILKQTNYLFRTVQANKEGGNRGVAVWGKGKEQNRGSSDRGCGVL